MLLLAEFRYRQPASLKDGDGGREPPMAMLLRTKGGMLLRG